MTVCVAAKTGRNMIVGASDRMLTAGDIEYEPESAKHFAITNSIVLMFSGDAALHKEVAAMVYTDTHALIARNPDHWVEVRRVADLYVECRNELKRKASEAAILAPLGLTHDMFLDEQANMAPTLVRQIAEDLINFPMPVVNCLVVGVDEGGAHIYKIDAKRITYQNAVAFAAIGIGHWHAESEMMTGGHNEGRSVAETVSLVHRAKKRAETAPGVGRATDMFMINGLGGYNTFRSGVPEKLDELYARLSEEERAARQKIHGELDAYVASLTSGPAPEQESAPVAEEPSKPVEERTGALPFKPKSARKRTNETPGNDGA